MKKVLIILLVIILGLSGFIVYDKFISGNDKDKQLSELKEEVKTLKSTIQHNTKTNDKNTVPTTTETTINDTNNDSVSTNFINAVYFGSLNSSSDYLILFNDGKFIFCHVNSHVQSGTYTILDGKLNLNYPGNNPAAGNDSLSTQIVSISNDKRVLTFENGYTMSVIG